MRGAGEGAGPGLKRSTLLAFAFAGIVLAFLVHACWLGGVVDDAFISFRYGRNLAAGHGFAWNVGEPPVEGFTSILWVLLTALAHGLGLDVPRTAQALGIGASLGSLLLTWRVARERLGLSAGPSLVPCLVLALCGPFAAWSTSGMETSLFACLVLAAAYHASGERLAPVRLALLLFLATLARPEGLGVFGLVVLGRLLMRRTDGLRTLALAYLAPFAVLVAWRYATFGDFVPNTFHAKTGLSPYVPLRGLVYAAYFALFFVLPWAPLLWLGRRAPRGPWALFATLAAGWTLYVVACGGDYMAMARFFVPILPLLALAVGAAFAAARPGAPRVALFALGAAITLVHSTPLDTRLFGHPRAQMGNYSGVVNERNMVARWSSVGNWLNGYRSDPDEEVASWVVGAIGWDADMRVLDMFGLNDRHIAAAGSGLKPLGLGLPGHERRDLDYVAARRPTYVLIEIDEAPRHVSYPDWGSPRANAIVNGEYAIRQARIAQAAGDTLYVYFLERTESLARRHSS